ncbi:hypothetical protein RN607_00555 [Demequina capsici]|uniref:Uncharacterized protein n=1 Tax=Demequina capsici TaxID=3075620 RepID=A0AA96JB06_9MICO|nr:hypothetical protein [Demequina sp. PMTSA13]WNM27523.1 hypothetical protein RN607_00555 [Demequina sp. PMTSA13]
MIARLVILTATSIVVGLLLGFGARYVANATQAWWKERDERREARLSINRTGVAVAIGEVRDDDGQWHEIEPDGAGGSSVMLPDQLAGTTVTVRIRHYLYVPGLIRSATSAAYDPDALGVFVADNQWTVSIEQYDTSSRLIAVSPEGPTFTALMPNQESEKVAQRAFAHLAACTGHGLEHHEYLACDAFAQYLARPMAGGAS